VRRVLLVSPHFPPTNAPDHQRIRMSLPFCREFGWDPVVLTVDQKFVETPEDPLLLQTIPKDVPIHRVRAFDQRLTRKAGLGNLGLRALPWIIREGGRLILEQGIELVYFSTAMFAVVTAGAIWQRRFGVPFVVDFQDPWLNTYYEDHPHMPRPRKYWFAHSMDKVLEPRAMKKAAGVTAVSSSYISDLRRRYDNIDEANSITLPFGASTADRELAKNVEFQNELFLPNDGLLHGVYAGVIASAMRHPVELIMESLAQGLTTSSNLFSKVRLHFVGTSYATSRDATPAVLPLAEKYGVTALVNEKVARVPYFHALRLVEDADFLIVPGSDDPQYTASKIYPYILARKPMLAIFHHNSSVVSVLRDTNAGEVIAFDSDGDRRGLVSKITERWRCMLERLPFVPDTDWAAFEPFTAREMTRRLCAFFDRIVSRGGDQR
jgi:hypothetical protein